ncbi:MAG: AsmA-like C-terminal region-containing protein, partial [Shewanella sp.]
QGKTEFSRLSGSFFINNGIVTNPDLVIASPLLQISGKGTANIVNDKLDYKLTASLVNVLKGQNASEPQIGVAIPLMISGTLQQPEYKLDTKALLNQQLKQETNKAKDKLKESILKKLGGF